MDFLRRRTRLFALVVALSAGTCVLVEKGDRSEPSFPHILHGEENGLDCTTCHRTAESSAEAGMPVLRQCLLCHAEMDEEKTPQKRADFFFEGESVKGSRLASIPDETIFSHQTHVVDYGVACSACHGEVDKSTSLPAPRVTMADCTACHVRAGRTDECSVCHKEIREDVPPASHRTDWDLLHGSCYRNGTTEAQSQCYLCHGQADCSSCHHDRPPRDHNNFFRQRGHGIAVSIDRNRCSVCHKTDSCDRCHQDTRPRSHVGAYGSTKNRHCLECHFPLSNQSCITCHKGTPSHLLATPKPPDHFPGMNCRQCHGLTAPLPHVDKGDNCNACHR